MIINISNGVVMSKNDWLVRALRKLHPSLALALLEVMVALAINASSHFQPGMMDAWLQARAAQLGIVLLPGVFQYPIFISFIITAMTRPRPEVAFYWSFPLILYGWLLLWYGLDSGRVAYPMLVLIVWGYIQTLVWMVVWPALVQAAREIEVLEQKANDGPSRAA